MTRYSIAFEIFHKTLYNQITLPLHGTGLRFCAYSVSAKENDSRYSRWARLLSSDPFATTAQPFWRRLLTIFGCGQFRFLVPHSLATEGQWGQLKANTRSTDSKMPKEHDCCRFPEITNCDGPAAFTASWVWFKFFRSVSQNFELEI